MPRKPKRGTKRRGVVVFDPDARQDYITGFRKRKEARRKEALDAIAARTAEENKEFKREVRGGPAKCRARDSGAAPWHRLCTPQQREKKRSMVRAYEALQAEMQASSVPAAKVVTAREDAFTQAAFGGAGVVVTTAVGLDALEAPAPSAAEETGATPSPTSKPDQAPQDESEAEAPPAEAEQPVPSRVRRLGRQLAAVYRRR